MKDLLSGVLEDKSIMEMSECFQREKGEAFIYGLGSSQKHACLAACIIERRKKGFRGPVVIVTGDSQQSVEWQEDFRGLLPEEKILSLPVVDMADFSTAAKSMELMSRRMDILGKLIRGECVTIVASANAAAQKGMSSQDFQRLSLAVKIGDEIEREVLIEKLSALGYQRIEQVDTAGQYSIRGGIVDVYPINALEPVRMEFFDNEVDSLRHFSLETQRSIKNVSSVEIMPVGMSEKGECRESFLSFVPAGCNVVLDEPMRIREQLAKLVKENPEAKGKLVTWEDIQVIASEKNLMYLALLLQKVYGGTPDTLISIRVKAMTSYNRQLDILAGDIQEWQEKKQKILFLMSDTSKIAFVEGFLKERNISSEGISIIYGTLLNGFELPGAKVSVVTEKDIFGHQKRKALSVSKDERITHFREIKEGDYVVHVNFGIGKYMGVRTIEMNGIHRDYLHIKYGGEDKLFLPVDQVHLLQKYIGSEGEVPELHKMSGAKWQKQVSKAKKAVEDIAEELIALYAARKKAVGYAFAKDDFMQEEFEEAFPYQETRDQLMAISDVKRDMEAGQPMDRLVCGDVGFGKTEVAIRAAFKAVSNNKQVAVLVPTTVLAQQHFQTFTERFHDFGVNVDVLNRFRSTKEQKQTLALTEQGIVKILIGTHALLNQKKVKFQDLGLLIVDEEQRFGVKQKEKIKKLATGVDVLTLSATPIPRTLHMSLVGTRDMSIIETAPSSRLPVQSYVVEDDDTIISNAIRRELKRGGQVYFVHNRIESIDLVRHRLEELVPEARIQVAHGQMPEEMLERVMMEFFEHQYDILLATTIIENGLDLPNANTIIVHDADHFGLSQLYQMRGRVGRSDKLAYAYFVYQENKVLTETAEKRLQAIKEFAELGAGFKIAMRDLEIRGAGNILGSQQHGHIASVGFEMYCHLLENAMESLKKGAPVKIYPEPVIELQIDAYLDSEYITDPMHKIEIYQRIAAVRTNKDLMSIMDELIDRFGEPPAAVINLLRVAEIKNYARNLGIRMISQKPKKLEISFLSSEDQKESGRTFEAQNMLKLLGRLGDGAQVIGKENLLKVNVSPTEEKHILRLSARIVKTLGGEKIEDKKNKIRKK